ncbi:hypothetical protein GIB67_029844 [Kingdonia uniflora]|uniref:Diacylglycerol O-acyltransferase 3 n=1 Tax=Kingdonia uniflora TaxID=39325 RepID=A0A7J7NJ65_9MAGN|nr:hypothetical protein GIB67_029844 [Kingdonia uniflora]
MEVSGVISRSLPGVPDMGFKVSTSSTKPTNLFLGLSSNGFADHGHLKYYCVAPRCGAAKKKDKKEKGMKMKEKSEMGTLKKKLKLIKGLSRDLSMFSSMGFGVEAEQGFVGEIKEKKISEAAEVLLAQLQQLRAEEKEMKRKRKEEQARQKAIARMNRGEGCELSSSSSSESSDSECGEVVDMSNLRNGVVAEAKLEYNVEETMMEEATPSDQGLLSVEAIVDCSLVSNVQEYSISCSGGSNVAVTADKIEVCMGGKCKKSGALALMEEFEKKIGGEGSVVGCKCMGKCRDGPNVRVLNTDMNSLCIDVGLEDVGMILSNFFGEEKKDLSLMRAQLV